MKHLASMCVWLVAPLSFFALIVRLVRCETLISLVTVRIIQMLLIKPLITGVYPLGSRR